MTEIAICEKSFLVREGIKSILHDLSSFKVVAESSAFDELNRHLLLFSKLIVILDPTCLSTSQLKTLVNNYPKSSFLCISEKADCDGIKACLSTGVQGFIFKDCDKAEIIDAMIAAAEGEKFFCGKAIEALTSETQSQVNCQALKVSGREAEIIRLIAEGLTNKEIADKLCLSSHTITTHRKNIMNKLGLSSTAGLVMFAIRENLIQPN